MMKFVQRVCGIVLSGCLMISAAACGDKKDSSDFADVYGSMAEEDLPYGATIRQLSNSTNSDVEITIEYDYRFITEEEAVKISQYMQALNDIDAELMENTVYPDYLSFLYTRSGMESTTAYLESIDDGIKANYTNDEDYTFSYILVNSFYDESASDDQTGFSQLDTVLAGIGGEELLNKITSRKMVGVDTMYTLAETGGSYSLSYRTGADQNFYLYTIDGEIYIL